MNIQSLKYRLYNLLQNINPLDLRGDVTADQACDWVNTCSNEWSTYKAISAKPITDAGHIIWNVTTLLIDTSDERPDEEIEFHVWEELGPDARGNGRIYGEW